MRMLAVIAPGLLVATYLLISFTAIAEEKCSETRDSRHAPALPPILDLKKIIDDPDKFVSWLDEALNTLDAKQQILQRYCPGMPVTGTCQPQ